MYSIPCSCGEQYIGQTGRCLLKRIGEHKGAVEGVVNQDKIPENSELAKHFAVCRENVCFEKASIIHNSASSYERLVLEAFEINRKQGIFSKASLILREMEKKALAATVGRMMVK